MVKIQLAIPNQPAICPYAHQRVKYRVLQRLYAKHLLIFQPFVRIIIHYLEMLRNIYPITDRGKTFLLQGRATFQVGLQGSQRARGVKIL
jgi:hypothetical protein